MSLQNVLLIFFFIAVINCQASNKLLDALKAQASKIATEMPSHCDKYVVAIHTNGIDGYDACASDQFNAMIDKYGFSSEIIKNFKIITFSQSSEFQTFHIQINQTFADIIEFIGAGANLGGTIQIAFLQVFAEGTPYPKKKYTSEDLDVISQALRASAYQKVQQFLETPPSRITNYKERETYLLDQNAWAVKMTEWGYCGIEDHSPCKKLLDDAKKKKCDNYSKSEDDERDACIISYIPTDSYWDPCFLCFCAVMFYAHDPFLPKANQACFSKEYPGVNDIYDPIVEKPGSIINIHFWNESEQ